MKYAFKTQKEAHSFNQLCNAVLLVTYKMLIWNYRTGIKTEAYNALNSLRTAHNQSDNCTTFDHGYEYTLIYIQNVQQTPDYPHLDFKKNSFVTNYSFTYRLKCCPLHLFIIMYVPVTWVSLEFFINIILPVPLWPWGRLSL
jgi:hypothetical protein